MTVKYCTEHRRVTQPNPAAESCYYCSLPLQPRNSKAFKLEELSTFNDGTTARTERQIKLKNIDNSDTILLSASKLVTLGDSSIIDLFPQSYVTFIPRRIYTNAIMPSMFMINDALISNISQIMLFEEFDAHMAYGRAGMLFTKNIVMTPANRFRIRVRYTGYIPKGYPYGMSYPFCIAFRGPTRKSI